MKKIGVIVLLFLLFSFNVSGGVNYHDRFFTLESKSGVGALVDVRFHEIKPDLWEVTLYPDPYFIKAVLSAKGSDAKLEEVVDRFFGSKSSSISEKKELLSQLTQLRRYPVKVFSKRYETNRDCEFEITEILSSSREVELSVSEVNLLQDKVSFRIYFKHGFKDDEVLKIGFKSIVYNAGLDKIEVIGDASCGDLENNPCGFEDVYLADVAGGWNQVFKQGLNQYFFNASLFIGNSTNTTWFADTLKLVEFGYGKEFRTNNGSHLRLGTLVNESTRVTRDGCHIRWNANALSNYLFWNKAEIELYSSTILNLNRSYGQLYIRSDYPLKFRIWNSKIGGIYAVREYGVWGSNDWNWYRSNIESSKYGIGASIGEYPKHHLEDVIITDAQYGLYLTWLDEPMSIRNLQIYGSQNQDFFIYHCESNISIIDAITDWSLHLSSVDPAMILFREYSFNLKVIDEEGGPLFGANVMIFDNDSNLLVDTYSLADGSISEQFIEYGNYNYAGVFTNKTPHHLTISLSGYDSLTTTWEMDGPVDWVLTLTDPCTPWTIEEINSLAGSGYNHENVSNYPMSWDNGGNKLTVWGDDGSGGKEAMGYDENHSITLEEMWAFSAYTKGTCIITKDSDDTFTIKSKSIIGDGIATTFFASENQAVWQFDYFSVSNNSVMRLGSIATDINNPYSTPKWGSTWTIDRKTTPHTHPPMTSTCFFVRRGGELYLYDSRISFTDGSKSFDTETGAYTYVGYSTFAGYDRTDPLYVRWWGELEFDHLHLHHCRNMNFPIPPLAGSAHLHIYANQNNLQVRDMESWVYDPILSDPIVCAIKVLQNGKANLVDPVGFNRSLVCVANNFCWVKMWHRFKAQVINVSGYPVSNVHIQIWNNDTNLVYDELTDVGGWGDEELLLDWVTSGSGSPPSFVDKDPFTIQFSHPDYPLTGFVFNLTDRVNWLISLGNMSEEGNVSYPTNLSNVSVKSVVHINDWVTARVQLKNTLGFYLEGQDCSVIVYEANSSNIVHDYDTLCMPGSAYIDRDGHWVSTSECRLTDSQGWYYFKGRIDEGLGFEYDESYDLVFTCNGQTKSVNFTTVLEKQPDVEKIEDLSQQYGGVFLFYIVVSIILLLVVICLIMFIVHKSQTNQ